MATSTLLCRPTSVTEALASIAQRPEFTVCAGGTALMLRINRDPAAAPTGWIFLNDIAELRACKRNEDGAWRIGSLVTLESLAQLSNLHMLAKAAGQAGSWQLRNGATIGGNLVTAWATSDVIPTLLALGAQIEIAAADGVRVQGIAEFLLDAEQTTLGAAEIVTAVVVAEPRGRQSYERLGVRAAMSPLICALAVNADSATGHATVVVSDGFHLAKRVPEAEQLLWSDETPEAFGAAVSGAARPVDNELATAAYRRHATGVLARRAFVAMTRSDV